MPSHCGVTQASNWSCRRLCAMGTRSTRVLCSRTSSVCSSNVTYKDNAGQSRPACSVKCCTTASGSMVILWPGMYTVLKRARPSSSKASPRCTDRPGAAMWMPTVTRPLPRPCTESASSISVVLESSIENACTSAKGNSFAGAARVSSGNPVPLGNWSNKNRFQWNW